MDPLGGLLAGPRARGAFVLRSDLSPPWALEVRDGAPLTVVALVTGSAWLLPQHAPPQRLEPGDVALARGPAPYVMADHPGTPPQALIGPGQTCATPDGTAVLLSWQGARVWGSPSAGATQMVTGTYTDHAAVSSRLLEALPSVVFTALVGQPPMGYLTAWRLDLAADLLLEPTATLTSVARRVGYSTPYALSAAFTRHHGLTPNAHRHRGLPLQE